MNRRGRIITQFIPSVIVNIESEDLIWVANAEEEITPKNVLLNYLRRLALLATRSNSSRRALSLDRWKVLLRARTLGSAGLSATFRVGLCFRVALGTNSRVPFLWILSVHLLHVLVHRHRLLLQRIVWRHHFEFTHYLNSFLYVQRQRFERVVDVDVRFLGDLVFSYYV